MNLNTVQRGILAMLDANGATHDLELLDMVRDHCHDYGNITVQTFMSECEQLTNMNQIIAVKYRREDIAELQTSRFVFFPGDCNIRIENYR